MDVEKLVQLGLNLGGHVVVLVKVQIFVMDIVIHLGELVGEEQYIEL
jgi:hypothetical protein